ncbi:MAG: hypothetical protein ACREMG_05235, partial [Gemmatimonadales bacterium]
MGGPKPGPILMEAVGEGAAKAAERALASIDWINRASRRFDVVPGQGTFRPFQKLDEQGMREARALRAESLRAQLRGDIKSAVFYSARAETLDALRPRGGFDVALLAAPAAGKAVTKVPLRRAISVETAAVNTAGEALGMAKALGARKLGGLKLGGLRRAISENVVISASHGMAGAKPIASAEALIKAAPRGSQINVVAAAVPGQE